MRNLAMRLKGCPRCHGDLIAEGDQYGWDLACLQCGYRQVLSQPRGMRGPGEDEGEKPASLVPAV